MTQLLGSIKTAAMALLFGCVMASVEPYPYRYDSLAFSSGATFFIAAAIWTKQAALKRLWLAYGLATVVCYLLAFLWFWWGAMRYGWWYPTPPRLVQQWFFVDGEGSYDAMVSNLFLVLWCLTSLIFAIWCNNRAPLESP